MNTILDKKTKIICTIGPSSWDPIVMRKMIEAGMNCARVNGAFADEAELDKVTKLVRNVSPDVALMVDVKGPEVRLNKFETPKQIKPHDLVVIGNTSADEIYPANYNNLYQNLNIGQRIVIGDGDVELVLKEIKTDKMYCEVVFGEVLKPGKAMNLPGASFSTNSLTSKDIINLKHAIALDWDFVSASFIQNAKAAREVKKYLIGSHMKLIAKIEDQNGVDNIDEILNEVEGIMIARGGLGVELGLEKVPMVEKMLIEKCISLGKPVITATQMLESMTYNPRPTRAEVNDAATAIMMGSDCLMLSGESSAGKYPIEAVLELSTIALEIEKFIIPKILSSKAISSNIADSLTKSAAAMCKDMEKEIDTVIVASKTGLTARLIGRHQIKQPIYTFVSQECYKKRLSISKGINKAFTYNKLVETRDEMVNNIIKESLNLRIINNNSKVLLISKSPLEGEKYIPNIFEYIEVNKSNY